MKVVIKLNYMNNDETSLPTPDEVADQVHELPPKVVLRRYGNSMHNMRMKGYTFREIAEWFTKTLGVEVNRNQVVYLLSEDPSVIAHENEVDEEEARLDQDEVEAYSLPTLTTSPASPPVSAPILPPPKKSTRTRKKSKP